MLSFVIPSKTGEHHGEAFDRNPKTGDNKGYAQYAFEKAFGHNMGGRYSSGSMHVLRKGLTDFPTRKLTCSPKGNAIFQPLIFKGYVSFQYLESYDGDGMFRPSILPQSAGEIPLEQTMYE